MVTERLMYKKLREFLERGWLSKDDKTLVVCGGALDQDALEALGLADYTITSLYDEEAIGIKNYRRQDVQDLSFEDGSFDNAIVHAGLHHCASPHKALCEMYRVARKNVIVFEAQDSALMRLFVRLGLALEYELDAVVKHRTSGGVDNLPIPNYIYRWTQREIEKLVRSLDPVREPEIVFDSEFYFHPSLLNGTLKEHVLSRVLGRHTLTFIKLGEKLLNLVCRSQGNHFTVLIRKRHAAFHSWIRETGEGYQFSG